MNVLGIDPVAFTIGTTEVRWYGIMAIFAIFAILLWLLCEIRKGVDLSYRTLVTGALVALPSGVLLSKLFHVIDHTVIAKMHPDLAATGVVFDYARHPGQIISGGGLTIYGCVLGIALGVWGYSKLSGFDFGYVADLVAPGAVLAHAIGRVGCMANGCCLGLPTSLPWGVVYSHPDSVAYTAGLALPLGMGLHPTPVYNLLLCLIIFWVLRQLTGRLKPDGSIFLTYLGLYSLCRLGVDFLREGAPFLFGLHQAQVISIMVLAIIIPMMIWRVRYS